MGAKFTSGWVLGCGLAIGQVLGCSGSAPRTDPVAATPATPPPRAGSGGRAGSSAAGSGGSAQAAGRSALPPAAVSGGSKAPAAVGGSGGSAGPGHDPGHDPADDADAGPSAVGLERREPDPNITFVWKETEPGVKPCEAGSYVGDFTCDLVLADGSGTTHIEGPVQLSLTKSQNGEFLEIENGHIEGYALLIFNFRAGLSGRLECSTRMLEATPVNGAVGLGDAALLPVFGFSGELNGTLNPTGDAIMGTWSFPVTTQDGTLGTCTGPWTAMRMAP